MSSRYSVCWTKAQTNGQRCPPRGGHSCIVADFQLVVFGGHRFNTGNTFIYLNDIWVLDIETMTWQEVRCSGELPAPRYGHSCELVGSRMFVIGGKGEKNELYRDVYFLDLLDWTWSNVNTTSAGPSQRFNHASVLVGRKIVVHGGWDGDNCFGDLWVFDTDSFSWMQPRTGGLPPSPRYGHKLQLLPEGFILLSGGVMVPSKGIPIYHKATNFSPQETFRLDTETMLWSKPSMKGSMMSARFGHSMTLSEEGQILMFGGWGLDGIQVGHKLNSRRPCLPYLLGVGDLAAQLVDMLMELPLVKGRSMPEHKHGHSCVNLGNAFFIFGGWTAQQATSELVVVELNEVD
ncbi:unnamed protein product [Chrysoparadoxa australica]